MTENTKLPIHEPLANKLRPKNIEEFFGQRHLVSKGTIFRSLIESDNIPSVIFWGPPGVGKTTLARLIAERTKSHFIIFSAVSSGIKEVREVMEKAERMRFFGQKTIIFVDEIHRFNKAQQDAFLPYVENGSVVLIGTTTENPSFEVNSALLSRCKVFLMYALNSDDIKNILTKAVCFLSAESGIRIEISDELLLIISDFSNGDARIALNTLEIAVNSALLSGDTLVVTKEIVSQCISRKISLYDKKGEEHFNLISALHKSMRNSDANASIYWLARMLNAGEDPLYIARRVVRFASEDIGMADSNALLLTVAAFQACHFIGMPECSVHLTHAVTYCALAPKSNSLYEAYDLAIADCLTSENEPVPLALRNAPTKLMKELHYGEGYKYAHDYDEHIADLECMPDKLIGRAYYVPSNQGRELKVRDMLDKLAMIKAKSKNQDKSITE